MVSYTKSTSILEVPSGIDDVAEAWNVLKTKRTHVKELKWQEIMEEELIEERLIEWCKLHFAQASHTPLADEKWRDILDIHNSNNI